MSPKTVCVIGSNSFSGGDFVDLLLEQTDYRVVGVSRSPQKGPLALAYRLRADLSRFAFHQLDLNRDAAALQDLLAERRPAFVVNFASQSEVAASWEAPEQWFETNATAVARLGSFLREKPWLERYVHISTPEVYGSCAGVVKEDAPFDPSTPYAASRAAGEYMLSALVKAFDFPLVVIRASNVYGARQQLYKIIPRTIISLRRGGRIPLHGGGRQLRSFIHIRDVSRGELTAMERGARGEAFNLSPDSSITIRDLVAAICERLGEDVAARTHETPARIGSDAAYTIDASRARDRLGWRAEISLDEGLDEVVDWVETHWDALREASLEYEHKP